MTPKQRSEVLRRRRLRLDIIDEQLAALIDMRRRESFELQRFKLEEGLPAVDQERERAIGDRILTSGFSGLASRTVEHLARNCRIEFTQTSGAGRSTAEDTCPPKGADGSSTRA